MRTHQVAVIHQNVIGFYISMENGALLQKFQSQQQLLGVRSNGLDVKSDILAELLENLPKIHAQWLHDHAQMLLVVKVPVETQAVVAIFRVGIIELLQELQLTDSSFVPKIIVSDEKLIDKI